MLGQKIAILQTKSTIVDGDTDSDYNILTRAQGEQSRQDTKFVGTVSYSEPRRELGGASWGPSS